ncbi:unnamed protein product [Gulo gulo]|uniref:Uncharacterized protein n=1 Tax=Gulo gulo TaxID=48420 RepID=A0A9X9Q916_GULGU|nr:unnamed protein product [Gulo gulo]
MLQKSKWNMDLLGRGGWAAKGTAGEKAVHPAGQQGEPGAERESLNACERVVTRKSSVKLVLLYTRCAPGHLVLPLPPADPEPPAELAGLWGGP